MDRTHKTSRTLFIEEHHEKLQREARGHAMWNAIMSKPVPKAAHSHKIARHGSHHHMLYDKRDSHHWTNVQSGGSFDEYDPYIQRSFDRSSSTESN